MSTPSSLLGKLRTSTLAIHEKILEKSPPKTSRKEIGLERSATLTREEGHDCTQIEEATAAEKAVRRIWGAYFRLCVTFHLDCQTSRGKTDLIGASSHCKCHGSHWNLTPTLLDNIIDRVIKEIIEKGITPRKELYCKNALQFTEDQIKELKENTDPSFVNKFFHRNVNHGHWNQSFKDTTWKDQCNSTIENHARSNAVDSLLEKRVRPVEDEINKDCYEKKIRPEPSLKTLVEKIEAYFTQSLTIYKDRKMKIERFIALNKEIDKFIHTPTFGLSISDTTFAESFLSFFKNIEELLELRTDFKTKNGIIGRFKKVDTYRDDFYTLSTHLAKFEKEIGKLPRGCKLEEIPLTSLESQLTFFQATLSQFKALPAIDSKDHLDEYNHYIQETEFQLKWTQKYNDITVINNFAVEFFGIHDSETGTRSAPKDYEMQIQLLHRMEKMEREQKNEKPKERPKGKRVYTHILDVPSKKVRGEDPIVIAKTDPLKDSD